MLLSPELPPLSPSLVKEAGSTLVVTGIKLLPVLVRWTVDPDSTLVIVVTTWESELEVIRVLDAVVVLVSVEVVSEEEVLDSEELVGVRVEVLVTTVTLGDDVGGSVIVEEVVTTESEEVSLLVAELVVSLVGVAVESVAESVESLEPEPPVFKETL